MKLEIDKPYKITWRDHAAYHDNVWRSLEEIRQLEPMIVTSYGVCVKNEEDHLTLVAHMQDNEVGFGEILILKNCIVDYEVIA